jgi:hypothetical protein
MTISDAQANMLKDLYYKKGETVGRDLLYESVAKAHPGTHPSRREVMGWLKKQFIYQRYLIPKRSGGISSFVPRTPLHSLSADLIDLQNKPSFGNYRYILVVVDNFSRYMWARATKGKKADQIGAAMKLVLEDVKREHPTKFTNDKQL